MALISVRDVTVRYTDPPLLDRVSFQLEEGERVCLLGRNGAGKSTFLKMLAEELEMPEGEMSKKPGLRTAYLPQEVSHQLNGSAYDVITGGFGETHPVDPEEEWKRHQQIDIVLSQMQLNGEAEVSQLSAGWKRRVLLARGLVRNPHVLLLDEPTNHLDIDAIQWLEKFLIRFDGTILFVTHDRMFLQKAASRIAEIDRGSLYSWDCDYQTYLQRKEEALEVEAQHNAAMDKKLAQEEEWLRRSPKARRTRNEGRVRALQSLREKRRRRREQVGQVKMGLQQSETTGDLVIEAKEIWFSYDDRCIVKDFSTTIMRGDKIGIIGPNGSGKTTLLKLLLNELEPGQGSVRHGTKLEIAYFDQLRYTLKEDESVVNNVGQMSDHITINGKKRHIIGYLNDFLFTPERARAPVKILSGGERNRVLLAKLLTQPANVLVLDEPTNDLDMETLDLLENMLVEFEGTILLVSHDRAFLNNVVTSTMVLEGDGKVLEYVGGYDDYLRQRKNQELEKPSKPKPKPKPKPDQSNRLSYHEKRELRQQYQELQELPSRIERLEQEQEELTQKMAETEFYKQATESIIQEQERLANIEEELAKTYQLWEELEEKFAEMDLKKIL